MSMAIAESKLSVALSQVAHPKFEKHNLVEAGMISHIAVARGKGGVGKSSAAGLLASAPRRLAGRCPGFGGCVPAR
jgi:Mrp family chromosome partitioning ATPase